MPVPNVRTFRKGPRGAATLRKTKKTIVVKFDQGEEFKFNKDEEVILCDIPKSGKVYAEVSADKTKLYGVRPVAGTFFVKVKDFAHAEDQEPAPRHYEGVSRRTDGTTFDYSYEAFTVLLEITRGDWKGTVLPAFLRYKFVDAGDGESAGISGHGKHTEILMAFLELAGLDLGVDTIPLSENVLPWLRDTLAARGGVFQAIIKGGYIQAYAPAPDGM